MGCRQVPVPVTAVNIFQNGIPENTPFMDHCLVVVKQLALLNEVMSHAMQDHPLQRAKDRCLQTVGLENTPLTARRSNHSVLRKINL